MMQFYQNEGMKLCFCTSISVLHEILNKRCAAKGWGLIDVYVCLELVGCILLKKDSYFVLPEEITDF